MSTHLKSLTSWHDWHIRNQPMLPSKTFGHCVFTDRVSHVVCHWIFACPVCVSHAPNLGSLFSIRYYDLSVMRIFR